MAITQLTACAVDMQQPRVTALLGRVLGNQFIGKVEVEVGCLHGGAIYHTALPALSIFGL
jgi:hypothetical protein